MDDDVWVVVMKAIKPNTMLNMLMAHVSVVGIIQVVMTPIVMVVRWL